MSKNIGPESYASRPGNLLSFIPLGREVTLGRWQPATKLAGHHLGVIEGGV